MASLTKRCRHRGAERAACGCTWYIRERLGGRDRYTNCGPDIAVAQEALSSYRAGPRTPLREVARAPGLELPVDQAGAAWLYFIAGAGLVKIGWTTDLASRLATLQAYSPVALMLMLVTEGGAAEERRMHARFRAFRRHGEWFSLPIGWENDPALLKLAA